LTRLVESLKQVCSSSSCAAAVDMHWCFLVLQASILFHHCIQKQPPDILARPKNCLHTQTLWQLHRIACAICVCPCPFACPRRGALPTAHSPARQDGSRA
jgi:hypothetical protein